MFRRIVERFTADQYLLRADHKKLVRIAALVRKSMQGDRMLEKLKVLVNKSVHNAFHHEVRAFAIRSKDRNLEALCASRLEAIARLMNPAEHPQ